MTLKTPKQEELIYSTLGGVIIKKNISWVFLLTLMNGRALCVLFLLLNISCLIREG